MRLITNVQYVSLNFEGKTLRLSCKALLLETSEGIFDGEPPRHTVRGFGPDSAWEVFSLDLGCDPLSYQLVDTTGGPVLITDSQPEGRPLYTGGVMMFEDGTPLFLQLQNPEYTFDISDYDEYDDAWEALGRKARQYYTLPLFPHLHYAPV